MKSGDGPNIAERKPTQGRVRARRHACDEPFLLVRVGGSNGTLPRALDGGATSGIALVDRDERPTNDAHVRAAPTLAIRRATSDWMLPLVSAVRRGDIAHDEGRFDAAIERYHEALRLSPTGSGWTASVRHRLGVSYLEHGQQERAIAYLDSALQMFEATSDRRGAASTLYSFGVAHHAAGAFEIAIRYLEECRKSAEKLGEGSLVAQSTARLGVVCMEMSRLDEAREALQAASPLFEGDTASRRDRAYFRGCLGAVLAMQGQRDEANAHLEAAIASFRRSGDPLLVAVRVHAAHLDLLDARELERSERTIKAERIRKRVDALVDDMSRELTRMDSSIACLDLRVAVRLLLQAVRTARKYDARESRPEVRNLEVDPNGAWFRVDDGPRVTCETRKTVRALLMTLAREAIQSAGTPVSRNVIMSMVWPGEKLLPCAAKNRVAVLVTTLRGLGLSRVLLHESAGYYFDPRVRVYWDEGERGSPHMSVDPI